MEISDADLLQRYRDGDQTAAEEIIKRYQKLVFNIIYHYLGRGADLEDLAQEVFLKFFQSIDLYDPTRPLRYWLGRIASNRSLDELRKRKARRVHSLSDLAREEQDEVYRLYEQQESRSRLTPEEAERAFALLQQTMDSLNPKDRLAFVLRELENMDYSEVAKIMETTELAARIRVSRARKEIREQLQGLLA